jgi:hypothetical protein
MLGNLHLVKLLLTKNPDVLLKDALEKTALDYALKGEHAEIVGCLKRAEAKQKQAGLLGGVTPDTPVTPVRLSPQPASVHLPLDATVQLSLEIVYDALTFGKEIGRGGFGVVYEGTYKGKPVAIKQLHLDKMTPAHEAEFLAEAKRMALGLRDANIIGLKGIVLKQGCYSLVMELMLKGSLFDLLHSPEELPWWLRYRITMDVVSGLRFLHEEAHLLHRDLKSLNVLLDDRCNAKITDFGLAKLRIATSSSRKGKEAGVGTTRWMAPELFGLEPEYSEASDIFALAIVMLEMVTRKLPYETAQDDQVERAIEKGTRAKLPADQPELSDYLDLIRACWSQEAQTRPKVSVVFTRLQGLKDVSIFRPERGSGGGAAAKSPAQAGFSALFRKVDKIGEDVKVMKGDVKVIKGVAEGQAAQERRRNFGI